LWDYSQATLRYALRACLFIGLLEDILVGNTLRLRYVDQPLIATLFCFFLNLERFGELALPPFSGKKHTQSEEPVRTFVPN
jgi:hypothetical protein